MNNEAQAASTGESFPNLIQRIMLVFFSPGKLGEILRERSPWFWTLAVIAIISLITVITMPEDFLVQVFTQGRQVEEGQLLAPSIMRLISIGSAVVMTFVGAAITAGVLYLFFSVFFGQTEGTFKQQLSAVAHAWWILTIGNTIQYGLQLAKGDATLRFGLGLILPEEPSSFGGFLLNNITIFGLWATVALALIQTGLSGGKVTIGKATTTLIFLYLLIAALTAVTQTLGAR